LLAIMLGIATLAIPWLGIGALVAGSLTLSSAVYAAHVVRLPSALPRLVLLRYQGLIALLYLLQPLARAWGRFRGGLGPLRLPTRINFRNRPEGASWQQIRTVLWPAGRFEVAYWSETALEQESFLHRLTADLHRRRLIVSTGSGWEPWDLLVTWCTGARTSVQSTIEYHRGPTCLLRLRGRQQMSRRMLFVGLMFVLLAVTMLFDGTQPGPELEQVTLVLKISTFPLMFLWLVWVSVWRVLLAAEILAAAERVAKSMHLIQLDGKRK
jgi:hypothetical protein